MLFHSENLRESLFQIFLPSPECVAASVSNSLVSQLLARRVTLAGAATATFLTLVTIPMMLV